VTGDAPTPPGHPVTGLDEVVHQRVRLGILTIAHEARRVEFGYLRTQLELTAGNLSKHLSVLEEAGLIEVEKSLRFGRDRPASRPRSRRLAHVADRAGATRRLGQAAFRPGRPGRLRARRRAVVTTG